MADNSNPRIMGEKVVRLATISSWYANGNLYVHFDNDKGERVLGKIHVTEIIKMVNEFIFDIDEAKHDKRRKYDYLVNPDRISDNEHEALEQLKGLI